MDFIPFTFVDFVDILLVALLMLGLYRMTRGTNAPYIFTGIIVIYIVWIVVRALNMTLLQSILGQLVSVGMIAVIILFQPERGNFLQLIGMKPKTGALIVLAQNSDLRDIIDGGITLDAQLSVPILENIFFKNAPLHDGAAIVMNNRVVAAKCILPVTQSNVPKAYGTRHRAAIGITETSDAIVVVVSEETGGISVAHGGKIERNIPPQRLAKAISQHFISAESERIRNKARRRPSVVRRDKPAEKVEE